MAITSMVLPRTASSAARSPRPLAGAGNIFHKEIQEWYRTRRFAVTAMLCSLLFGAVPIVLWIYRSGLRNGTRLTLSHKDYAGLVNGWLVLALTLGAYLVIALTMGIITKEEDAGTAQWVFTKPVSRSGYVLAKWSANTLGAVVAAVLIPSAVFFGFVLATTTNGIAHPGGVALALLLAALNVAMTIAVIIAISSLVHSQGVIAGVTIGVNFLALAFSQPLETLSRWLVDAFPVYMGQLAGNAAAGNKLYPFEPVFVGLAVLALSLALACRRIGHKQLQ